VNPLQILTESADHPNELRDRKNPKKFDRTDDALVEDVTVK
jgi:hypothetical protein